MNRPSRASRRAPKPARRRPSCGLQLEHLEDRLTLNTHAWTGLGGDGLWSNPDNWNGGTPAGDAAADLVFAEDARYSSPLGTGIISNNNLGGLTIRSITFTNQINEYWLVGSRITLTRDVWDGGNHTFNGNDLVFDVALTPASHNFDCLGGTLIMEGLLGGPGGTSLSKWGAGAVDLLGRNTYTGPTTLYEGTMEAVLPSGGAVTVMQGATPAAR
jgi:autotransporter-associated beta strand protein